MEEISSFLPPVAVRESGEEEEHYAEVNPILETKVEKIPNCPTRQAYVSTLGARSTGCMSSELVERKRKVTGINQVHTYFRLSRFVFQAGVEIEYSLQ